MNYYERHIGDYAKDTAHLSLLEHGVYSRLLDVYYTRESPIPADQVHRLIGCRSPQDRKACDAILAEFFQRVGDTWRQSRCDAEIEKFISGAPEREAKAANRDLRWKKHRRERAEYFRKLHAAGQHADWNIPIKDLRALVERYCDGTATESVAPATETATPATRGATAPNPTPSSQSPDTSPNTQSITPERAGEPATPATPPATEGNGSPHQAHELRLEIEKAYPAGLHRGDHWMLAERAIRTLLDQGVSADQLLDAAAKYCEQQRALGNLGKHEVLRPSTFYAGDAWRGPFPLPTAKADPSRDALMRRLSRTGTGS